MSLSADICRLPGCAQATEKHSAHCPSCLDVPKDDIFSERSNHKYCCTEHLLADEATHAQHCKERVLWRTLVRIGTIYNMLFMCRAMNMSLDRYLSSRMVEDKVREVIVDWPTVKAGERWYPDLMDPQVILGAVSSDQCRIAITLLSPVLAWLSEGLSIKIREIRFPPINKRCQVYNLGPSGESNWADLHDVVLLVPASGSEALTLDASSMQYGHVVQTHRNSEYVAKYQGPMKHSCGFGKTFNEFLDDLESGSRPHRVIHLTIQRMNNVVWEEVESLGGRGRLYEMGHDDFVAARDKLGRAVCRSLIEFRRDLNWEFLDELPVNLDGPGPGNRAMQNVMARWL